MELLRHVPLSDTVGVGVTDADVRAFKARWPGSGIPVDRYVFRFDVRNGDLVAITGPKYDGEDMGALADSARSFANRQLDLGWHERNPRHYGDLLKGNPRRRFGSLQEKMEVTGRRWFPGAIALGVSRDARTWYAHRIETDIGWDFPTLQHLFPFPIERVRTFGDTLVRITFMPGDHRFKLKTDRGWTKPLPLSTRLSPEEIDAAAGFAITGVVRSGAPI